MSALGTEPLADAAIAAPAGLIRPSQAAAPELAPTLDPGAAGLLYGADVESPRRDSLRRRTLAMADVFALLAAYAGMWVIATPSTTLLSDAPFISALPLWVLLNKALHLYDRDANLIHKSTLEEFPQIVHSLSLGAALIYFAGPLLPGVQAHRPQTGAFWALAILFTPMFRIIARRVVRARTSPERVLLVGSGHVAGLVSRKIRGHKEYGVELVGYVDTPDALPSLEAGLPRLGDISRFEQICRENDVERVVVAFSSLSEESLLDVIRIAKRLRAKITIVPRLFEVMGHNVEIDQIEGMTLLGLRPLKHSASTRALKRTMDIVGAGFGLLVASPIMALAAIAIKVTSPGPVLFAQRRVGRHNREFRMLKFRTMVEGADAMKAELLHLNEVPGGTMFKMRCDPRVTPIGRFLRATSLDELPQLVNVLRGEMSLVGPRPLVPEEDDNVIGWHRARLDLTPGLTGPWQVMGRNQISFHEMVKLDYLYVSEWSLWNDITLLLRTLPVVFGRSGA